MTWNNEELVNCSYTCIRIKNKNIMKENVVRNISHLEVSTLYSFADIRRSECLDFVRNPIAMSSEQKTINNSYVINTIGESSKQLGLRK